MEENLNKSENISLKNCIAEGLTAVNDDLDNLIGQFKGEINIHDVWSYQRDFETYMRSGKYAISDFEKYVIEHPTEFDNETIEEFESQKDLYEFRKEILIDIFKEAFKGGFEMIR